MGYVRLDEYMLGYDVPRITSEMCEEIRGLLGLSYDTRYDGVKFYYYKNLVRPTESRDEVLAFLETGAIVRITPVSSAWDRRCRTDIFYAKDIKRVILHSVAKESGYDTDLEIEFPTGIESIKLDNRLDCNGGWQRTYAEQIRAIAAFLAQLES